MATVTPTYAQCGDGDNSYALLTWVLTTTNSDGAPFEMLDKSDIFVQMTSAALGGATFVWQGSNDGTNWLTLNNVAGSTALSFTAAGGGQVIERPRYMRPNLSVVGAAATLTITAMLRRNQPGRL